MSVLKVEVGEGVYLVNGVESPRIYLTVGRTYTFEVNARGHPFHITTDARGGTGFQRGAITQAVERGSFDFTPTSEMINMKLYYQCDLHPGMGYKIHVK